MLPLLGEPTSLNPLSVSIFSIQSSRSRRHSRCSTAPTPSPRRAACGAGSAVAARVFDMREASRGEHLVSGQQPVNFALFRCSDSIAIVSSLLCSLPVHTCARGRRLRCSARCRCPACTIFARVGACPARTRARAACTPIAQCPRVRLSLWQSIDEYIALRARGRAAIAPRAPAVQRVCTRCTSNPGRSAGPPDCALTRVGSSSHRRPCCDAHGLVRSVLRLRLAAVERDVVLVVLRLGAGGSVGGGWTAVGGRQKARCGPV